MIRPDSPRSHHASRRVLAIAAAVLWMLGFEIGPGVHLAFHDLFGDHTHEGDRAAIAEREHGHPHAHAHEHAAHDDAHEHGHTAHGHAAHGHAAHEHGDDDAHEHGDDDAHERGRDDAHGHHGSHDDGRDHGHAGAPGIDRGDHGRHSLAHRGLAVRTAPPAMPWVGAAPWAVAPHIDSAFDPIRSRRPSSTRARGPPRRQSIV